MMIAGYARANSDLADSDHTSLAQSKPRLTQAFLTGVNQPAGLPKLELDPTHTKINLRFICLTSQPEVQNCI